MRYIRISDKFLSFFIDITQNYSPLDKIITFGRVAFCFVLLLSYPLLIVPCRATINKIIWSSNCRTDKECLSSYKSRIMRWTSNSHHNGPNTVRWNCLLSYWEELSKWSPWASTFIFYFFIFVHFTYAVSTNHRGILAGNLSLTASVGQGLTVEVSCGLQIQLFNSSFFLHYFILR